MEDAGHHLLTIFQKQLHHEDHSIGKLNVKMMVHQNNAQ